MRTLAAMGMIRKLTSTLTLGAVDFRSDKERTALYARQTRNAVEAQRQSERSQRAADASAAVEAASDRAREAQARYDQIRRENQKRWGG